MEQVVLSQSISYIRGVVDFIDNSRLFFFELLNNQKVDKYRYHYQNKKGELIFRYDNAPHHKSLKNFPHHKHLPNRVVDSKKISFEDVLDEIHNHILNSMVR
ncbi:MAG: hypothetical protein D6710_06615 [Nitrospirae bacterium]|nr:MAG: hypothetical protein D6710_06615 [Nitrospirota bacterium]